MNRAIYPILSGALAQEERIQVLSNNIANVKTNGFKRSEPVFKSVLGGMGRTVGTTGAGADALPVLGGLPQGANERVFVRAVSLATHFGNGNLKKTDNQLDMAIQGKEFFEIRTPQGVFYTRNGAFRLNPKGQLVTESGYEVMGDKGPITLKAGDIKVSSDGRILVDGNQAAKIKLVEFPEGQSPEQVGGGLFTGLNAKPAKEGLVSPGYLEEANVNSFTEMVRLVEVMRTYEAAQKLVLTFDKMTETSIQDLGRPT